MSSLNPFSKKRRAERAAEKLQKQQQQQSRASSFLQTPAFPVQRSFSNSTRSSYTPSRSGATPGSRRSSASSRSSTRKVPFSNNGGTGYGDGDAPPAYTAAVPPKLQSAIQANLNAAPSRPSSRRNSGTQPSGLFNRALTGKQSHETLRRMQSGDGQLTAYKMFHQLKKNVLDKHLERFYNDKALNSHVRKLFKDRSCQKLKESWKLTDEESSESAILSLWDVCLLIDDSGSMEYEPQRKADLKDYVSRITPALTYFDQDGIDLYFMNAKVEAKHCKGQTDGDKVEALIKSLRFKGVTPLGRTLLRIFADIKLKISAGKLDKPVLILILTDGEPEYDGPDATGRFDDYGTLHHEEAQKWVEKRIKEMKDWLIAHRLPKATISYQFAQVGDDPKIVKWFKKLDGDSEIGDVIDCTSRFEAESKEAGPEGLTVEEYLLKLLLGAIGDRDKVDESSRPSV